jgi:hemerythrin
MSFIEWTEAMSVGSSTLDTHHQMIFDCLNALHPLLDVQGRDDEVHAVLNKLEDFVLVHFSEEEQAMKKAGYPDWKAHKQLHDRMYEVVFNLKSDVEHGRTVNAAHLFELVNNWLVQHIMGEDKKYVPYLTTTQAAPSGVWVRGNGREC